MTLKRPIKKEDTESFIRGGGLVASDIGKELDKTNDNNHPQEWTRVTISITREAVDKIDTLVSASPLRLTRTAWILEAIEMRLKG